MRLESPYHEGELLVQQQAGEVVEAQQMEKSLLTQLKGALKFIEQQQCSFLVAWMHSRMFGYLCCSGIRFTKAIDPQTIDVDLNQAILHQHDPFWSNISQNDRIGMLVIELASRRRLRY